MWSIRSKYATPIIPSIELTSFQNIIKHYKLSMRLLDGLKTQRSISLTPKMRYIAKYLDQLKIDQKYILE